MLLPLIMNLAIKLVSDKVQASKKEEFLSDIEGHVKDYILKNDAILNKIKEKIESLEHVLVEKILERKLTIVNRIKHKAPDVFDGIIDGVSNEADAMIKDVLDSLSTEIKSLLDGIVHDTAKQVEAIPHEVKALPAVELTPGTPIIASDRKRKFNPYLYITQ